jgi:hypothetical protein
MAIITLFRPLQEMNPSPQNFKPKPTNGGEREREVLHPCTYVLTHCQNLLNMMTIFRLRWSHFRHCFTSQCHYLPAYALLFYLRQGEASADAFTQAVRGLREIGQKWTVAMWMLQGLQGLAKYFNITLPKRSLKYFENLDLEAPRRGPDATDFMLPVTIPSLYRSQDSGLFPFPNSKEVGGYVNNLNNVLDQLSDVNLNR